MALTLAALAQPSTASVRLTVSGAADGEVTILRQDGNGSNLVRQPENNITVGGVLIVDDWEPRLTGPLAYTVTDESGATATRSISAGLGVSTPWLTHPGLATLNRAVTIRTDRPSWAGRSTPHQVYLRTDPVFTIQPAASRTGTLDLECLSWTEANAVRHMYDQGVPLLLRNPCLDDADYYHVVTGDVAAEERVEARWGGRWGVTVGYTQVAFPAGHTQGSARWQWGDVPAAYTTWKDATRRYASWAAFRAGPAPL